MAVNIPPSLKRKPELVDPKSLTQLPGNPNRGHVESVANSLSKLGQQKPIVVWSGDHDVPDVAKDARMQIAGNTTNRAAITLDWDKIAVVDASAHYTWEQAKAFAIADNRSSRLGVDDPRDLAAMLATLQDDPDLLAAMTYDESDVTNILSGLDDPDTVPVDFDAIDVNSMTFDHRCPSCGFGFDD